MFFASGFLQASVALCSFPLSLIDIATHVPKSAKMSLCRQSIIFLIFADYMAYFTDYNSIKMRILRPNNFSRSIAIPKYLSPMCLV